MAQRGAVPARPEEGGSLADAALELEEALEDAPRVLPVAEEPIPLEGEPAAGGGGAQEVRSSDPKQEAAASIQPGCTQHVVKDWQPPSSRPQHKKVCLPPWQTGSFSRVRLHPSPGRPSAPPSLATLDSPF